MSRYIHVRMCIAAHRCITKHYMCGSLGPNQLGLKRLTCIYPHSFLYQRVLPASSSEYHTSSALQSTSDSRVRIMYLSHITSSHTFRWTREVKDVGAYPTVLYFIISSYFNDSYADAQHVHKPDRPRPLGGYTPKYPP